MTVIHSRVFDPPLDAGIAAFVHALMDVGVETFESCEGGAGHCYPEPTIRFHGGQAEGLRALSAAIAANLPVGELRRTWPVVDGEVTGPWWELTFAATMSPSGDLSLFYRPNDRNVESNR
jgi:hypothetical protein